MSYLPIAKVGLFQAALAAAPLINDSIPAANPGPAGSQTYSTSGLTAGTDRILAFTAVSNSPTLSAFAGDTNDTSTAVASNETTEPDIYIREMTLVSGLDANFVATFTGSARGAMIAAAVSGLTSIGTPANNSGAGASLPSCAAYTVTGGPRNFVVVDFAGIRGAHVTNPPAAPTGFTLLQQVAAQSGNDPTNTDRCTIAVAVKTYAAGDLTWTLGEATVPAATFTGLANIGTQTWATTRIVLLA